jgi:hypothetical protein
MTSATSLHGSQLRIPFNADADFVKILARHDVFFRISDGSHHTALLIGTLKPPPVRRSWRQMLTLLSVTPSFS